MCVRVRACVCVHAVYVRGGVNLRANACVLICSFNIHLYLFLILFFIFIHSIVHVISYAKVE